MKKFFIIVVIFTVGFCAKNLYAAGECEQFLEVLCPQKLYQYYGRAYPVITSICGQECGGDADDVILEYNIPDTSINYGSWKIIMQSPDKFRVYSDYGWINTLIKSSYWYGLSANGLCGTKIRVCVGSKVKWIGQRYLSSIYLWYQN